ncbi:MAG: hypothetical protein KA352_10370 [Flavobacteriales bacterium]|nr:hypothetical protein [Flavobacteriales bacterium]
MRKTVLFAVAVSAATAVTAQTGEITSNRGENWLSQDGDWGLIFDATPLINYAGNLFNGTAGNGGAALNNYFSSNNSKGSNVVIGAKKLVNANTAYRGMLRIGFGSDKSVEYVSSATAPATDTLAFVEDVTKASFLAIDLGFGLEKRVGSTRVVGVYGAMFNVGFGNSKRKFEYGNALTFDNQGTQVTESKDGSTLKIGLAAFGGVEWFCAPKVSLSGEYTWGFAFSSTGAGESTKDTFVVDAAGTGGSVVSTTNEGTRNDGIADKSSSFGIDTGVTGAKIGLNFYFQ